MVLFFLFDRRTPEMKNDRGAIIETPGRHAHLPVPDTSLGTSRKGTIKEVMDVPSTLLQLELHNRYRGYHSCKTKGERGDLSLDLFFSPTVTGPGKEIPPFFIFLLRFLYLMPWFRPPWARASEARLNGSRPNWE